MCHLCPIIQNKFSSFLVLASSDEESPFHWEGTIKMASNCTEFHLSSLDTEFTHQVVQQTLIKWSLSTQDSLTRRIFTLWVKANSNSMTISTLAILPSKSTSPILSKQTWSFSAKLNLLPKETSKLEVVLNQFLYDTYYGIFLR